jgi:hypothetical protein
VTDIADLVADQLEADPAIEAREKQRIRDIVLDVLAAQRASQVREGWVAGLDPLKVATPGGLLDVIHPPGMVLTGGQKVQLVPTAKGLQIAHNLPDAHPHVLADVTDYTAPATMPAEQQASDDSVQTKSTAGVWASGTPGQDVTFVAASTGRAVITTSARARCASNNVLTVSFVLHAGTGTGGTQVLAEAALRGQNIWIPSAAGAVGNPYIGGPDKSWLVGGLTPGNTYTAQLRYDLAAAVSTEIRARVIRVNAAN